MARTLVSLRTALLLAAGLSACTPVTPHVGPPGGGAAAPAPRPVTRPVAGPAVVSAGRAAPSVPVPAGGAGSSGGASSGPVVAPASASAPVRVVFHFGDEQAISVWKEKDLDTTQRIQRDGTISPLLLGSMPVVGRTVDEVRADLEQRYTEYLREPKVSVRVVSVHAERVFVLGEVRTPSAITLNGPTTIMQALAQAGGFNQDVADQKRVRIIRAGPDGRPTLVNANVASMLTGRTPLVQVLPGDVVYVPPTGLAEWSRGLTQALGPVTSLIGTAGSIVTSYAAIKTLEDADD